MIADELATIDLDDLRDWVRSVYGVCLIETERGWAVHLHAPPGGPVDQSSALGPFAAPLQAIAAGMQLFHERLISRWQHALEERYAAMQRAGLTIFREAEMNGAGERQLLDTWGYLWTCGCTNGGYASEVDAIEAALTAHAGGHRATAPVLAA